MLNTATFKCNFCGQSTSYQEAQIMWTKARFCSPVGFPKEITSNDLFDLEWTHEPLHNLKGSHICDDCVNELVELKKRAEKAEAKERDKSVAAPEYAPYTLWRLFMCDQESGREMMIHEGNERAMRSAAKNRPDDDLWLISPEGIKEVL